MSRYHFRKMDRSGPVLAPNDSDAAEWLAKQKNGACIEIEPTSVRNAERNALYRCICRIVAESHPTLTDEDAVSDMLQILAGQFNVYRHVGPGGSVWFQKAKSTAFANMKEHVFEAYMDRAFRLIETELLPGSDIEEMKRESLLRSGYRVKERKR